MGKISEILGKRSQNVTGEVMVEVGSTKQQLKTPWAQKAGDARRSRQRNQSRRSASACISSSSQQYFEEIRKAPAKPAAKPPSP